MDTHKHAQVKMYELRPTSATTKIRGGVFAQGRILLGRTESCDLVVNHDAISAVHAVLEIFDDRAVIYDMNSTNGTYVNDDKVVVKEMHLDDVFRLADVEFKFVRYSINTSLPPVLETLEPEHGSASVKLPPGLPPEISTPKKLPKTAPAVQESVPSIVYPLASDPRAEFSEYIFEDKQELYPIFKYESEKQAVEVIILFKDQVFSVDYLPEAKAAYHITGIIKQKGEVEFPYLGKNEKFPFIDINSGHTTVQTLPGFGIFYLGDKKKDTGHQATSVTLRGQDLVRLQKDDLQIFVRNVQAPPMVAHAPILKRDPDFRKYLFLFLFFVVVISVGMNAVTLPEDTKKEEMAPETLATILYKQPLFVNTNKSVAKTEDAPKIAQKAPPKPAVAQDAPKEPQPEVKKPDIMQTKDQTKKPDPGKKTATEKKIVKQGTEPVTKPTNQIAAPAPAKSQTNKITTAQGPSAFSTNTIKSVGHVEVYKSPDFSATVSSLVAKGGSLSGVRTQSASGSGGEIAGAVTGISSGSGNIKTAGIQTNQGSLVGATTGVLGDSKGAEGLSAKKAIYTAGIPSETVVLGSMDPDTIRRILLDHLPHFRYCYQKELEKTGSEMSGVIKLDFTIGASGHVTGAGAESAAGLPIDVKKCVIGVLKGITFPEPMGGGSVEVKQPMNFYPKKV
jgi:pSer/pThr/pTyr-binding forkhead associated (FHA) protein/outer membrane biosynthesis protein TonB